jgi:hypothetical protein
MYLLELTDGETTINLKDSAGICVEFNAWAPAISGWLRGGYPDVHESIPVQIRGTSGTAVMIRLREVTRLIDQARRFALGENLRPVLLRYQQTVSSAIWVALIIGGTVDAPPNFTNQENWKTLYPVYLEMDRRGQWLTPDQTNLVTNGGFEDWTDDEPDDWTIVQGVPEEENTIVYEGGASLKMVANSGTMTNVEVVQIVALPAGTEVVVSLRAMITDITPGGFLLFMVHGAGSSQMFIAEEDIWQYAAMKITAGTSAEYGGFTGVAISVLAPAPAEIVAYVDDVQMMIVEESGEAGDVATDTAVTNGDIATLSFATGKEPYLSPTKVIVKGVRFGVNHPPAVMLVANEPNRIKVVDSDDFGWLMGAPFTEETDTAAFALGGKVARFTPTTTDSVNLTVRDYDLEFYSIKRVAIWANVRNNSSTTTFTLRAYSFAPGGTSYARPILIAGDATPSPQWRYLGAVASNRDGSFFVTLTPSAASGTLDIDSIVLVALDRHVAITAIDQSANIGTTATGDLILNHRALSGVAPQVEVLQDGLTTEWGGRGEIAIYTSGSTLEGVLLATGGDDNVNRWRQSAGASEAVVENDWTASRLPGRLTPE